MGRKIDHLRRVLHKIELIPGLSARKSIQSEGNKAERSCNEDALSSLRCPLESDGRVFRETTIATNLSGKTHCIPERLLVPVGLF